jgi:glycosyltransferase involved in cell wall biosynthesis
MRDDALRLRPGRLRILHVTEPASEGVTSVLAHFVEEQSRAGHDVHVLGPAAVPRFAGATQHRWRIARDRPWTAAPAVLDLRRTVRQVRPDVVHLHSFVAGFLGRLPGQRRWLGPVPVVYQPHAWSFELYAGRAVSGAVRGAERRAAARTDVLVANCAAEVDEGRSSGIDLPAHVLGVPVDLERFHPVSPQEQAELRRRLGVTAPHLLVCVGRIGRQKGHDLLVSAWERSRPPDTELVLVGPGDADSLATLAPMQWGATVRAVGGQSDVRPWLWASDTVVLPSRYETVGVVVAEAMACARPVVATAVNGARVTLVDGPLPPAGAVVEMGDMDALLDEATRRLKDPDLAAADGESGRLRADELFRPGAVADRLEQAYRDAIERHRAGAR